MRRADQVADAIARDIRSGLLGAGAWLKQVDLEARYSASRGDVRRALDILAVKHLVQQIPERGFYVLGVDEHRRHELREVRALLEVGTARHIVANATEEALSHLASCAARFRNSLETGDARERYEANHAFHVALTSLCSNKELANLVIELRDRLPTTRLTQWQTLARAQKSANEHFEMIKAIRARDVAGLEELIGRHIEQPDQSDV